MNTDWSQDAVTIHVYATEYYALLYILLQWSSAIGGLFTGQPFNTFTSMVDREKQRSCEILILQVLNYSIVIFSHLINL